MTRKPTLGPGVAIDLDALVNTRLLIQANSGGGKSWCLRRLLEQTHGQIQHLVIDPEGEFASLRERFDYILAAKRDGDTLADPRSAPLLAHRLLELGVSAVVDIFELRPDERRRFVRLFLDALVDAPKSLWHPALVVLDEAHVYCPETGDAESADAVKSLATRGRKRGFCAVLATQRLAKLAKDAAAECNNKLIGRTAIDIDMKRASDELGFVTREDRLSLRELENGEFFAFGPALTKAVTKVTVGGVLTTHPKAGAHLAAVAPPPTARVKAILAKLSDLPQEAERKAATEADLRAKVTSLTRELEHAKRTAPPPERIEVPVLSESDRRNIDAIHESARQIAALFSGMNGQIGQLAEALSRASAKRLVTTPQKPPSVVPARSVRPIVAASSNGHLGSGERKILTALAQYHEGRTKVQVALLATYAVNGGGFNNYIGSLRSKGWIVGSDPLCITDEGLAALGSYEPLPVGHELVSYWRGRLGKAERAIFDVVVRAYPRALSKEEIGHETGYEAKGGGFNNALGRLRTLELITRGSEIAASEHLF